MGSVICAPDRENASTKQMQKRQTTSTELKIYRYITCHDVQTGEHNIYVKSKDKTAEA